jgi:RNA polymerase sigma factor FliA
MHRAIANYSSTTNTQDDAAVLAKHSGMIDRIARRMVMRTGLMSAYDDLWSAGALGLLEAVRRFDATKGASFETFAEHRVRGSMLDELRRMDHLPRRLRSRTDDLVKAKRKLSHELGRDATVEEVATEMKVDLEEAFSMEALLEPHVPLEKAMHFLASEDSLDDPLLRAETVNQLVVAIEELPERLKLVLSLHYVEGLTYREIGRLLQVSEPRVCQIHSDALGKLREIMGAAKKR